MADIKQRFKYPAEDEIYVRRLGSAVVTLWNTLPADIRQKVFDEAVGAWDREFGVRQLSQKLDAFIKSRPARIDPL